MPDDLTFLMGKHPARVPAGFLFARNHMWCRPLGDGVCRWGFSAYAVRLMQDVYFLDWCVDPGAAVAAKQRIGNIETSKAVSDLFAPLPGEVVQFNQELLADPSGVNVDCYGPGWLFDLRCDPAGLMDPAAYVAHLGPTWEAAQRILKAQVNTEPD
jgi:glycine cleavage system H protein